MKKCVGIIFIFCALNAMNEEELIDREKQVIKNFLAYLYSPKISWPQMYKFATADSNRHIINRYYEGLSDRSCMLINAQVDSKKFDVSPSYEVNYSEFIKEFYAREKKFTVELQQ